MTNQSLWNSISRVFHHQQTPGDHVMTVGLFPSTVTKNDIDNMKNDGDLLTNSSVIVLNESFERSHVGSNKATTTTITTISTNTKNAFFRRKSERRKALADGEEKAATSIDSFMVEGELSNLGPDALVQRATATGCEKPNNVGSKVSNKLQKVLRLGKANMSKLQEFVSHQRRDDVPQHKHLQQRQRGIVQLEEEPDVLFYEAHDEDDAESTMHHHRNGVPKEIIILPESQQQQQQQQQQQLQQHVVDVAIRPTSSSLSKLHSNPKTALDRSRSQPVLKVHHNHRLPEDVNLNVREVKKLRLQVDEYRPNTFEAIANSLPMCTKLEKLVVCRGTTNPENFAHRKRKMEEMHMLFMSLRLIPKLKILELENFDQIDTHMLAKPLRKNGPVSLWSIILTMKPREIVDERFLQTLSKIPCLRSVEIVSDKSFPFAMLLGSKSLENLRIGVLRPQGIVVEGGKNGSSSSQESSSLADSLVSERSMMDKKKKKSLSKSKTRKNKKIRNPAAFSYELNSEHVMYLAGALENNTMLTTLDLEPLISSFSLRVLGCALQTNTSVERFCFSFDPALTPSSATTAESLPSKHHRKRQQKLQGKDVETPLIEILDAVEVNTDLKVLRNRCYNQVKVSKRLREMTLDALADNGGNISEFKFFKEDGSFYHSKHEILSRNRSSYENQACYEVDAAFVVDMFMCGQLHRVLLNNCNNSESFGCQKGSWVY